MSFILSGSPSSLEQSILTNRIMRAYRRVTAVHGASQPLLDFVGGLGNLANETGLESLQSFSTQAQHEILLSEINRRITDKIGTEGLGEMIGRWLGKNHKKAEDTADQLDNIGDDDDPSKIGSLDIDEILTKGVVEKSGASFKGIENYSYFNLILSSLYFNHKVTQAWLHEIPDDFSKESWDRYVATAERKTEDLWDQYEDLSVELANAHHKQTENGKDWSPNRFREGVRSYIEVIRAEQKILKDLAGKLTRIQQWVETEGSKPENKSQFDNARNLVSQTLSIEKGQDNITREVRGTLKDLTRCFEITPSDQPE